MIIFVTMVVVNELQHSSTSNVQEVQYFFQAPDFHQ